MPVAAGRHLGTRNNPGDFSPNGPFERIRRCRCQSAGNAQPRSVIISPSVLPLPSQPRTPGSVNSSTQNKDVERAAFRARKDHQYCDASRSCHRDSTTNWRYSKALRNELGICLHEHLVEDDFGRFEWTPFPLVFNTPAYGHPGLAVMVSEFHRCPSFRSITSRRFTANLFHRTVEHPGSCAGHANPPI